MTYLSKFVARTSMVGGRATRAGRPSAGSFPNAVPGTSAGRGRGPLGAGVPTPLAGETPRTVWRQGDLRVNVLPCRDLGNSSFLLEDRRTARAIAIDPTRDVARYVAALEEDGLGLDWVLTTHTHADFVSGAEELAGRFAARVASGSPERTGGAHRVLRAGDRLALGAAGVEPIPTPGHAPDHVSYLLTDGAGRARVMLSGGSLMAGSAGRADLGPPAATYRAALDEFETLHRRFAGLPSDLIVLPTHLGGSFCGVGARPVIRTTLGLERATNPLLRTRDRAAFLARYLSGRPFPRYYARTRSLNEQSARQPAGDVGAPKELPRDVLRTPVTAGGPILLDVRSSDAFDRAHVPGSVSLPAFGAFSGWVGWLFSGEETFVLVSDSSEEIRDAQVGLLRIGFDGLLGAPAGGFAAYATEGLPIATTPRVTMTDLGRRLRRGERITVVDVRHPDERSHGLVPGAWNIPLPDLTESAVAGLDRSAPLFVHCQSGHRAGIAASLLQRWGFTAVHHVLGAPPKPPVEGARRGTSPRSRAR